MNSSLTGRPLHAYGIEYLPTSLTVVSAACRSRPPRPRRLVGGRRDAGSYPFRQSQVTDNSSLGGIIENRLRITLDGQYQHV